MGTEIIKQPENHPDPYYVVMLNGKKFQVFNTEYAANECCKPIDIAIEEAVAAEREKNAKVADKYERFHSARLIAAAIRKEPG